MAEEVRYPRGKHPFLAYCYGGIPQRFRHKGRLLFVVRFGKKDKLMEIKE